MTKDEIKIYDDLARNYINNGLQHYTHTILHDFYLFLIKNNVIDRRQIKKFGYEYVQDFLEELNDEANEVSD